jgi:ABC-type lipoprotein release transport system permease subunit
MGQLFRMAYRNLLRNRTRSFLSALALGVGLALLIFMSAIIAGELTNSLETAVRLESGHLQVLAQSYDENKISLKWNDLVEDPFPLAAQIAALPGVKAATPRLYAVGIAEKGDDTASVRILGIDPASAANDPYRTSLISGEYLTADDRDGILIGQTLANKMHIAAGENLYMLVNTSTGDVAEQSFAIRGIYNTQTPAIDGNTVLMPIAKAQGITGAANHASAIFVLLANREQAGVLASSIPSGYQVKTWNELNSFLMDFEQMANGYMFLLYLIILGIAVTVIVNTLVMAVFERTREIGILSAIGMKGRRIMTMFFAESSLLALAGIVIGLALGIITCLVVEALGGIRLPDFGIQSGIYLGTSLHAVMTSNNIISLSIITFVFTLIASLYPASLAARMDPVEALHGGK